MRSLTGTWKVENTRRKRKRWEEKEKLTEIVRKEKEKGKMGMKRGKGMRKER